MIAHIYVLRSTERVTFVGQRLCLVVFPQLDPSKTTSEEEWTDQYSDRSNFPGHS